MRTAGGVDGNFGFAERTLFFRFFLYFFFGMHILKLIDLADQQEYDEADDNKIDHLSQKRTVIDGGGMFTASEDDHKIVKIDPAGKQTEQRHKNVIYQRADDSRESASYYHTDSQIDHISL